MPLICPVRHIILIMATVTRKRKRTTPDIGQKQQMIPYHDKTKSSQQQISDRFSTLWSVNIKRRVVGDILSQHDKWLADNTAKRNKRHAKHTDLDQAFWLWLKGQSTIRK